MAVGGYALEVRGADELKRALEGTERGIKDLSKAHRQIGKMAGDYVRTHEPMPANFWGDRAGKSRLPDGYLQAHTKGSGGKSGAWVTAEAPYIFVQEFGGKSFWHRQGAGSIRKTNRAHRSVTDAAGLSGTKGHVIYTKPRKRQGYFIWNVAFRLRSRIGQQYMDNLRDIAMRNGLTLDIVSDVLDIEELPPPTRG